jgi:thioredoxin-dependent peroxiredoxin
MEMLSIGSKLPEFKSIDQNGKEIDSKQLIGKKTVVYFYPKDNTPGCTAQACSIRDNYAALQEKGIEILGISADSLSSHQKFSEKFELPFSLLVDEERKVIEAFGVWGTKKFMGKVYDGIHRITFLFDENGELVHRIDKPNTKDHATEILSAYNF